MNGVLAVYGKEIKLYFRSPIAYFILAVFLLGTGYFFSYNLFVSGLATMRETFQNMGLLAVILLPAVSMRLFATEYSAGTYELLATLRLAPWEVVVGKYLGALTMLGLMALGTMLDLVPLYLFGAPETTTIISGYLGFLLLGSACLAIGQLCSSLTRNQIVAALVTVSILLGFWFVGHLQSFQTVQFLRELFLNISFAWHFGEFIEGLARFESLALFVLFSVGALILNVCALEWRR